MTGPHLGSLADLVRRRREHLRRPQGLEPWGGPSVRTVRRLERGVGPVPLAATLRALDRALELPPGAAGDALCNGRDGVYRAELAMAKATHVDVLVGRPRLAWSALLAGDTTDPVDGLLVAEAGGRWLRQRHGMWKPIGRDEVPVDVVDLVYGDVAAAQAADASGATDRALEDGRMGP